MSHYNVKPLAVLLQPSRRLTIALLLAGIFALVIIQCMPLSTWIKVCCGALISVADAYFIARDGLLILPWSWRLIELNNKGQLFITGKDGIRSSATVQASSFVADYLTVLNIKVSGKRCCRHALLLPDNVDSEQFRKLRVWLRWGMPANIEDVVSGEF